MGSKVIIILWFKKMCLICEDFILLLARLANCGLTANLNHDSLKYGYMAPSVFYVEFI